MQKLPPRRPGHSEHRAYYHWDGGALGFMRDNCLRIRDDLAAWREKHPHAPAVLCGHSYGGSAAMHILQHLPEGNAPLILVTLDAVGRRQLEDARAAHRRVVQCVSATLGDTRRHHTANWWPMGASTRCRSQSRGRQAAQGLVPTPLHAQPAASSDDRHSARKAGVSSGARCPSHRRIFNRRGVKESTNDRFAHMELFRFDRLALCVQTGGFRLASRHIGQNTGEHFFEKCQ